MTTLNEMISIIKAENPTIQVGDNEQGYTQLSQTDYDAQVADWAQGRLDKQVTLDEAESVVQAKVDAATKLIALGIDPKALGL